MVNRKHTSKELDDHVVQQARVAVAEGEKDVQYDVTQGEIHSTTHIEDDRGEGKPVVIRTFDFQANPDAFKERTPSKQELFNAHASQIERLLMIDGLKVMPEVNPQLKLSKNRKFYRIVVGAEPMRGFKLNDRPLTLKQIHDSSNNTN